MKTTSLTLAILASVISAVDITRNPALDLALKNAATRLDRSSLLVNANSATFPAVVGNGMTMAMLNLGPCAMLPPHFHPRATNFVVAIEGETKTYMIEENGARIVSETLTPGKMTIFPAASLHTMQNTGEISIAILSHQRHANHSFFLGCGNSTLVSALNSEDPGTHNMANGLFNLPASMVFAAFGYNPLFANISQIASKIPGVGTGSILGDAECLKTCNLTS